MAELAKVIRATRQGGLEIDGQEFPWYITEDGVNAHAARKDLTTVTITIPCERVELVDTPWLKPVQDTEVSEADA